MMHNFEAHADHADDGNKQDDDYMQDYFSRNIGQHKKS
jgi:hypothetical protein